MKKKLHICLIAPVPPPYGGIGNWVVLLKKYIEKNKSVELSIINTAPVSRGIDGRSLWDRIIIQGILMLKKSQELKKAIRNDFPDVIHITTSGQLAIIRDIMFLKIAKKRGIPTIYHIRFGRINDIAKKNTIEWKLISKAMKYATKVMVIDGTTYDAINKYLPKVQTVYVPNPIDISSLPAPKNGTSKTVMFLGWVVKTKGIEELLIAWGKINKDFKDWKLEIVGPCNNEYLEYLKNNYSFDGVVYEGEKSHEDAMKLLNNSEIFILPSYTEGFPNVILEAMALSKPIIATRVGAIPEMLSENCGVLIEAKNAQEIEKTLEDLIVNSEKRKQLGINANRKVNEEYSIDTVFVKYMCEWKKLSYIE